ncbi:MAG: MnhB domain-containing protein [Sulfurimonas sp.]|nr:MnhB domain-containing protein [Sulfurimonas sp.]
MTRFFLLLTLFALFIGLSYTVISLPQEAEGLGGLVNSEIQNSGVSNPVTAVLMNFRAYDTFLEMAVLFVALLGVYSLNTSESHSKLFLQSSVLKRLGAVLIPILILLSAYLLWVGAHAPGGAFQAGSVLSALFILIFLSGWKLYFSPKNWIVQLFLVASLLTFLTVCVVSLFISGKLLELPQEYATFIIFILEALATLSIGITLFNLFVSTFSQSKDKS